MTKDEALRVLETAAAPLPVLARPLILRVNHARSGTRGPSSLTLGFAVVLIYLVLAAQFQSFRDP